jgi:hypothetical protein
MEANDANLGDVLRERPLTVTETTQVARSVHSALAALHASGLVHEHIEPVNVLAVGETVKLRSDCVRECIADIEFNTPEGCAALRRRDVHDFGLLLLQCLTLEKRYNPGLNLPDIFRRLIPHMLDGSWSLDQVGQLLNPPAAAAKPATAAASATSARTARPQPEIGRASKAATPKQSEQVSLPLEASSAIASTVEPRLRYRREVLEESGRSGFNLRPWLLGGVAALIVCVIVIWHFISAKSSAPILTTTSAQTMPVPAAIATRQPAHPSATHTAAAARPAVSVAPVTAARAAGWYVIAWTYNHQSQAQTKAERINARNRGFHAEVFSPRGGTFLISLGGPMSEPQAKELQQRARRSGLPSDTYIRRY